MVAPSFVLLCAGAVASLAGVWWLAGLSERSSMSRTPRVIAVIAVGLVGLAGVYYGSPDALRSELLLPVLFALASVLSLTVGTAKLESALQEQAEARALRRAAGLLTGTFLSMTALAAASLELAASSVSHARLGWMHVLPLVAGVLVVFAQRIQLAGAAARSLGRLGLVLGILGLLALLAARYAVVPRAGASPARESARTLLPAAVPLAPSVAPVIAQAPLEEPSPASALASALSPSASAAASPVNAGVVPSAAAAGSAALQIVAVDPRGMMEADARGGVMRRFERLESCVAADPNKAGELTLKIGLDSAGSVNYAKVTAGDLSGTPLANCLLPVFYKMGFAAPRSGAASFRITLRTGGAR